jgi:hypothetical protein
MDHGTADAAGLQTPDVPEATVNALVHAIRTKGKNAFVDDANRDRLRALSHRQVNEIAANSILREAGIDSNFLQRVRSEGEIPFEVKILAEVAPIRATPFSLRDGKEIPPREFLYGRHLTRKFLSATVAPGGAGKTKLALAEAVAMASGRALLATPTQKLNVWYWNGEDPLEEIERQIAAICMWYGISNEDIKGSLFVDVGRQTEIKLGIREGRDGFHLQTENIAGVMKAIIKNKVDVLFIDPFVSSHAVAENDNGQIDAVCKALNGIAEDGNCAIELLHHVRKSLNGNETVIDDARGAKALIDAVRSAWVINTMSSAECGRFGIDPRDRRQFFRVEDGKANLARFDAVRWFQIKPVELGNGTEQYPHGDSVGVVTTFTPSDFTDAITPDQVDLIVKGIQAGSYRENAQANDWAGNLIADVLDIDVSQSAGKKRVNATLKSLLRDGSLATEERLDGTRKKRLFITAGRQADEGQTNATP